MYHLAYLRRWRSDQGDVAVIDTSSSWIVVSWEHGTDHKELVEEWEYRGEADRRATRAMARGTADSYADLH